eukprot:9437817-Alexandrium_andersonii.AAC.1
MVGWHFARSHRGPVGGVAAHGRGDGPRVHSAQACVVGIGEAALPPGHVELGDGDQEKPPSL